MGVSDHYLAFFLCIVQGFSVDVSLRRMGICTHDKILIGIEKSKENIRKMNIADMIALKDKDGLTYKEIGQLHGINPSAAHKRIARGRHISMKEQTIRNENSAFDRVCNIVDAFEMLDKRLMYRRIKEAQRWLNAKRKENNVTKEQSK